MRPEGVSMRRLVSTVCWLPMTYSFGIAAQRCALLKRVLDAFEHRCTTLARSAQEFLAVLALIEAQQFCCQRWEQSFIPTQRLTREGERRAHPERRSSRDLPGELDRAVELFAHRRHVLHQTEATGFLRAPFLARQHVAHGIAPTNLARQADSGAGPGKDATRDLTLAEFGIGCCHPNICGKE